VWEVDFTPQARQWFDSLSTRDAERVAAAIKKLEAGGPGLGRPHVDRVKGSRHHNMKELRSVGGNLRGLFAFDPRRRGILLLGGDKTNDWNGWYKHNIPTADRLYDQHLRATGKEQAWQRKTSRAGERSVLSGR